MNLLDRKSDVMTALYEQMDLEIKKFENIVIVRHIGPDPDALGSQFGLKELIEYNYVNKNVLVLGSLASRFKYMGNLDKNCDIDYSKCLLIVLDTPDVKRIDIDCDISRFASIIKIDHHPVVDKYANIEIVDDNASSTSQLIIEFIIANNLKINEYIAKCLYTGIVSDTDRFLHDYTSKRTFEVVNYLLDNVDINLKSVYQPLYLRPLDEIRFQGYIYENITVTDNGLAYIKITDKLMKEFNVDSASAGNMINELKYVDKITVWVFFSEDVKSNLIRANIRSRGPYINDIAMIKTNGNGKTTSDKPTMSARDAILAMANLLDDDEKEALGRYQAAEEARKAELYG